MVLHQCQDAALPELLAVDSASPVLIQTLQDQASYTVGTFFQTLQPLPEAMISIKFRVATGIPVRFRSHSQMCLGKPFSFPKLSIASLEFPENSQILGSS